MQWQSPPYILVLFSAALISFLWALYGLRTIQRDGRNPSILPFVVLCLAVTIWSAVYALQLASPTLEAKLLAYKILHIGGVVVPPAWLAFAVAYSGRSEWLTPTTVAGIVAIPLALLLTLFVNPYSLALTDVTLETHGSLTVLVTENGPFYLLYLAYSYIIILVGACLIVLSAIRSATQIWRQSVLLVAGAVVPLVLNVFNVLAVPPVGDIGVNVTPVSLALSTILFGVALFRYRLLDFVLVAWDVVLAQMSDGVIVLDSREQIVDLNSAAEALLGKCDTVLGADISSLLPQFGDLKRDEPFLVALQGVNDEERLIQLTRSPLTKRGETYGWVVLAQDVTVPERQRRELEQQNTRLDGFAKVVAHDLRNPLTVIAGYTDLAEQTGEKQHFEMVREAVSRMETFLEELLLLSQQGKTVQNLQPVSLATACEAVRKGIADDRLLVETETDSMVMADENRLHQVLDNLFRNARDHNDGDVVVRIGELADGFYVEDDGPGIPAETRKDVFEAGFSTRPDSSGFGLAIILDIIEAHGWTVSVSDGATGGARFEINGVSFATRR